MKAPGVHAPTPAHPGGGAVQSHVSGHQMVMLPGTNECPVKAQHLLFWGDLSESSPQCAHMDLLLYSFRRYSPQQGTSVGLSLHSFVGVLQAPALLAAAGRGGAAEGKAGRQAFLGLTSSRKGGRSAEAQCWPSMDHSFLGHFPLCVLPAGPSPRRWVRARAFSSEAAESARTSASLSLLPPIAGWSTGSQCGDSAGSGLDMVVGICLLAKPSLAVQRQAPGSGERPALCP